jgi:membrane protein YqaA with SNARE-associated domain
MRKFEKIDWFLIIFLATLVILTVLCLTYPGIAAFFDLADITNPESGITFDLGSGLFWVSIACFLGALVPFPVPYVLIVGIVANHYYADQVLGFGGVLLMVIIATLVNAVGDFVDWIIGYGGGKLSEKGEIDSALEELRHINEGGEIPDNIWARLVFKNPAIIPVLLLLFGMTPLPDSLLFIPLGVINYSLKKTMFWNAVGKFLMMLFVALLGIFTFELMFTLFGGGGEFGWVTGMIVLYLSWALMAIMTKFQNKSKN